MENKDYLFVYDTSGIKDYVFGSDKLKEIKGASAILDHLNRQESEKIIQSLINEYQKIYANGGTGQFVLKKTEPQIIEKLIANLNRIYARETVNGVKIVCGYAELKADSDNYQEALSECYFRINRLKNAKFTVQSFGSLLGKSCGTLSGHFASLAIDKKDSQLKEFISEASYKKRMAKTEHLWDEFVRAEWNNEKSKTEKPESFKEIADDIGLVYADGNAMGKIIKSFTNPEEYEYFAKIVDNSIKEACHKSLKEIYPKQHEIKADILMLGGDDLIVVLRASDAFNFACKVTKKFNEITSKKLKEKGYKSFEKFTKNGFTISTGVSIGKANFPFRILLEQAEELLKSAKKRGSEKSKVDYFSPSYIDFHVNKQANQLKIGQYREENYQFKLRDKEVYQRSMRPFSLETAEKFFEGLKNLKNDSSIGRTRIHLMKEAINEATFSKIQLKFMHVYGRTKKEERENLDKFLVSFRCTEKLPWNNDNETIIMDLSDLIDWVGN